MSSSEIKSQKNKRKRDEISRKKKRMVEKMEQLKKSKKHFSAELEAVNQYLKDLEPACVDGDSSYEDRKKARSKEIEALKKAEGILQDAFKEQAEEDKKEEKKKLMFAQLKKTSGFLHSH